MTPGFENQNYAQALDHLVEEMGELLAAIGKTSRFGPLSYDPTQPPDKQETNIRWVLRELSDVETAIVVFRRLLRETDLV